MNTRLPTPVTPADFRRDFWRMLFAVPVLLLACAALAAIAAGARAGLPA